MTRSRTSTVFVVGSANVDLTVHTPSLPRPGETVPGGPLRTLPGGKSANQAAAAALLGGRVDFVAAVGDDTHGDLVLASLTGCGVDTRSIRRVPGTATGTAMIAVDSNGENFIIVSPGANDRLVPGDVTARAATIARARVMGLSFEVPLDVNREAARLARDHGVRVVLNPSPFSTPPDDLLADVDILVVNEHEFFQLVPAARSDATWHERSAHVRHIGVSQVVITLGPRGAVVLSDERVPGQPAHAVEIPAPRVDAVDTTGCGDAFTGALLQGLASGRDVEESVVRACAVGACAATEIGAQASYPTAEELDAFLDGSGLLASGGSAPGSEPTSPSAG